ncbi:MAG: hypothetical protein NWE76_05255 [Candidatus Bathyarchaeota archaeon]|nr:hypothetical protein [Candidatus Bathyarchaeota archaeon]
MVRGLPKFTPKCPECGSVMEKAYTGYLCPNPECKVVKVLLTRGRKVKKVTYEGFSGFGTKKE